jgi:hypothetical protein
VPQIAEIAKRADAAGSIRRWCAAFGRVAARDDFWATLQLRLSWKPSCWMSEPGQQAIMADDDYLDDIAAAFARVIDAKSPFTHQAIATAWRCLPT